MKPTPLLLFLLLLVILISSVLFSRFLPLNILSEGFVSFRYTDPTTSPSFSIDNAALINTYSATNKVVKLYDSVYLDPKNGNLIEVDGNTFDKVYYKNDTLYNDKPACETANSSDKGNCVVSSADTTGSTVKKIYVVKRSGDSSASNPYAASYTNNIWANGNLSESQIPNVSSCFRPFRYETKNRWDGVSNHKYQVFYFPWNNDTYIHIIKLGTTGTTPIPTKHAITIHHQSSTIQGVTYTDGTSGTSAITVPTGISDAQTAATDGNNGKVVRQDNKDFYQLSKAFKYDYVNGRVYKTVTTSNTPTTTVYNRVGDTVSDQTTAGSITNAQFTPKVYQDAGGNLLLVVANSQKTLLASLLVDTFAGGIVTFKLGEIAYYTGTTKDTGTGCGEVVNGTKERKLSDAKDSKSGKKQGKRGNAAVAGEDYGSDYNKWLAYWNTVAAKDSATYSEDYMLKTQVVPPVCPSCPSCNSSAGVCTNCGGQGGSGTFGPGSAGSMAGSASVNGGLSGSVAVSSDKGKVTTKDAGTFATTSNTSSLGGATTTTALGAVSGVENVAKSGAGIVTGTVGTVGGLVGKTIDTTSDLLKSAGSGAKDLVKSGAGGAVDLVKSGTGGAVDLVKSAGSGVKDVLTQDGNVRYSNRRGNRQDDTTYGYSTGNVGSSRGSGYQSNAPGVDYYSYYGALPSKGGNFIPITADFSAFGK